MSGPRSQEVRVATAVLWHVGVCGVLGAVLLLVMLVQHVASALARLRSSVSELPQRQLDRPLRPAA